MYMFSHTQTRSEIPYESIMRRDYFLNLSDSQKCNSFTFVLDTVLFGVHVRLLTNNNTNHIMSEMKINPILSVFNRTSDDWITSLFISYTKKPNQDAARTITS